MIISTIKECIGYEYNISKSRPYKLKTFSPEDMSDNGFIFSLNDFICHCHKGYYTLDSREVNIIALEK